MEQERIGTRHRKLGTRREVKDVKEIKFGETTRENRDDSMKDERDGDAVFEQFWIRPAF